MSETKVDETKPSEVKPKKMVSRRVAIALGIICIILVAGLGMALFIGYAPTSGSLQTTYNNYVADHHHTDEDYNQVQTNYQNEQSQYNSHVADHHHTDEDYNQVQTNYQNEQNLYNSYVANHSHTDEDYNTVNNIANLQVSTVWVKDQTVSQPASSYTVWTVSASYAGYVSVLVQSSTVAGTHVEAIYSSNGVNFNQEITVSAGDTAYFPILPSSSIQIGVGNGSILNGATETVTVTYHY
jgi:hypothetical protein